MPDFVLRRVARGVSTRDYANAIDLTRDGFGVQKSSVSRDFVRASAAQVKTLAERLFYDIHFAVLLIDRVEYAGETLTVVRQGVLGAFVAAPGDDQLDRECAERDSAGDGPCDALA
jgi:hypothetical protein